MTWKTLSLRKLNDVIHKIIHSKFCNIIHLDSVDFEIKAKK